MQTPFNVLRNLQFVEMVNAIKKAPDGYKPPSSEKRRTVLPNEYVEKELTPFKDIWYLQGVSIVFDGWSNVNHNPLINVVVNSRRATFMYDDFFGVEKTRVVIANFLQGAIETVGANNVLQLVTTIPQIVKLPEEKSERYTNIYFGPLIALILKT